MHQQDNTNSKVTNLALLKSQNTSLDRVLNHQALDRHRTGLTKTMNTIECLVLDRGRPSEVDGDDAVGTGEILQSERSAFEIIIAVSRRTNPTPPHFKDMSIIRA